MTGRLLAPDAHALALAPEPLPAGDVVAGSPLTGIRPLGDLGGVEVGVWEITSRLRKVYVAPSV